MGKTTGFLDYLREDTIKQPVEQRKEHFYEPVLFPDLVPENEFFKTAVQ